MSGTLFKMPCSSKLNAAKATCARPVSMSSSSSSSSRVRASRLQYRPPRAGRQDPSQSPPDISSGNGKPETIIQESDVSFVGKLVIVSFAGAILIKYGSLLTSLPFEPNGAIATGIVLGTPAVYSLYLLTQKQQ